MEAEAALAELRLGVFASVVLASEPIEDTNYTHVQLLTFGKTGRGWRLLVQSGLDDEGASQSSNPVCDTSRETRLLAAKKLPLLLEELIKRAEEEFQDVRSTTEEVKGLVQAIRGAGGSK